MIRKMKRLWSSLAFALCFVGAAAMCTPILVVLSGAFMSQQELSECLKPIMSASGEVLSWKVLPFYPTFEHFKKLLFFTPQFYVVFWNSVKLVLCILIGQLLIAVPGAWAFAVYRFRGRKVLFSLYVVLMLLPFQVTMLSQYLVLNELGLMNTHGAVILPAVFSTFPVFLIYRGFCSLPQELLESARIDGAGEWKIFRLIGLPLAADGIFSAAVLGFLEYWSLIEQPLAFLEDKVLWPLSLYLPEIGPEQAGSSFAASVITLIPPFFVFLLGQEYLEQGIAASAIKQ